MKLKLKDGKVLELENAQDGLSIAKAIAVSLAKKAIAIKVDGELEDLSTVIDHDAEIEIITKESPEAFQILNHSAAHVLAQAIMRLYPDAQLEYGPSIEEGFFYDIGFSSPVSEADFAKIEKEMSKISDAASFEKELKDVETLYQKITGEELTRFYRPPQGKYNTQNLQMAGDLGYKTFFWSLAYVDWIQDQQPTKEAAFDKLLKRIHPGAVVLLHSTSSTNAQILDELLTKWEEMGYHFAPLSELAEKI